MGHQNWGKPVHMSGTATTTAARQYVKNAQGKESFARSIIIDCTDATNALQVSFDDGTTFFTITPSDPPFRLEAVFTTFVVKAAASTSTWSAVAAVA